MKNCKEYITKIVRIVLFFGILLAILVVSSIGLKKNTLENERKVPLKSRAFVQIENEKEDTIEVLFVGDSLCCRGISPKVVWENYGYTSYVAAQTGQNIQQSYFFIKKSLETQSPKVIALESNAMCRNQEYFEAIQNEVEENEKYYMPVFRFHDNWKMLVQDKKDGYITYKGYCPIKVEKAYNGKKDYMGNEDQNRELQPVVNRYMKKIMDICKENNIELCLVSTPSPVSCNYGKHNAVKKFAEENDIDFLDMNLLDKKELSMNWKTDTYDGGDHLNTKGATKVSKYYGKYLQERFGFENKKNDEKYSDWNTKEENNGKEDKLSKR